MGPSGRHAAALDLMESPVSTLPTAADKRSALESELIDTSAVAALLSVSDKTVTRLPVPGRVTLGRSVRFIRSEVLAWIKAGCPR